MATQNLGSSGTLAGADAVLKEYYPSAIVEQLNQKTFLLDQIDRDTEHVDFTGRRAIIPLHRNRNRGRVSIGDGGTLPGAGKQDWVDATVTIRYHASAIELSDAAIQATKNNEGAFVSLLEAETKGVAQDLKKDINRQVFGTGDGVLTKISANSSGTVTCTSVQYVQVGDCVDVVTSSGAAVTNGSTLYVVARSVSGKTVGLSTTSGGSANASFTYASGQQLVISGGISGVNSYGLEMDGLQNISATTSRTLHGVDSSAAANAFWNPQVVAAGGAVTDALLTQLIDKVGQTGQGEVDTVITTRGIRRAYAASLTNNRRYNDAAAVKLHTGYTAIMVNEIPIIIDDDAPKGFVFAFDKKAFRWFELAKPGFLEQDSGIFTLKDGSNAQTKMSVWQAFFRWYAAFGCVAPNRTGALTGVTDEDPV
jgi:hypothetical protein